MVSGPPVSRVAALVALGGLAVVLVGAIVLTTPWHPLGHVPGGTTPPSWHGDFTAAERARDRSYHSQIRPPAYAALLTGLVVAGILGLTPLGARVVTRAGDLVGGGWIARVLLGGFAVTLLVRAVTIPFDVQSERVLRRFGLSTQTWPSWLTDQLKGLALGALLLAVVLVGGYAVIRHAPRTWWAWLGAGAAVLTIGLSFLYPILVEPLFNKFTSMPAGTLRTDLLELAGRDGVKVGDVLVADASRRTTAENAYVSGFGGSRRIVVYDTLLKARPEEVRLVVAHELGHAKRNDVLRATLIGALGAFAGVCLLFVLMNATALLRRAGADAAGDPRSVALALFLVAAMSQVAGPAVNVVSRRVEANADVHSLELTRDPITFAEVERRLARSNISDLHPNLLLYGLFATHPSTTERIALARDWARQHGLPPPGPLATEAAGATSG